MPGLAQAAVHGADGDQLFPPSLFQAVPTPSAVSRLTALLPSLTLSKKAPSAQGASGPKKGIHAFTALARILADPQFSPASLALPVPLESSLTERVQSHVGGGLIDLTAQWAVELEGENVSAAVIEKKIEELAWLTALVYGVGGWGGRDKSQNKEFNADFFM